MRALSLSALADGRSQGDRHRTDGPRRRKRLGDLLTELSAESHTLWCGYVGVSP